MPPLTQQSLSAVFLARVTHVTLKPKSITIGLLDEKNAPRWIEVKADPETEGIKVYVR